MKAETPGRVYSLSYLPPHRRKGREAPELIIKVPTPLAEAAELRLVQERIPDRVDMETYLGRSVEATWSQLPLALSADRSFGIASCAYVREIDGVTEYHFPLSRASVGLTAMTLHLLLFVLGTFIGEAAEDTLVNQRQLISVRTRCNTDFVYAHAASGNVYPEFRRWLARLGASLPDDNRSVARATGAMKATWKHVAWSKEAQTFANDCWAFVSREGRFHLHCMGSNDCNIALNYDTDRGVGADYPSLFSCHNLDAAAQQLTLLAGLAVLHDMAVEELG